jgi:Tfp pilus assembly protein PilO
MFKNLSQAVLAGGGRPLATPIRRTGNQRSRAVIQMLCGIAGLVLLIGAGICYLLMTSINHSEVRVANLQAEAGSSKQVTMRFASTQANYDDTASQLSFLESSVSQNQFVPTLLQQLQTLAESTNLQVQSVKPGILASMQAKPTASPAASAPASTAPAASNTGPQLIAVKQSPPAYDTQPISLQVNGTYPEIMAFIYDLPKFPKILSLQSIALHPAAGPATAKKDASIVPVVQATLLINAYVFDASSNTAAPVAATPAPGTITAARNAESDAIGQASGARSQTPDESDSPTVGGSVK